MLYFLAKCKTIHFLENAAVNYSCAKTKGNTLVDKEFTMLKRDVPY